MPSSFENRAALPVLVTVSCLAAAWLPLVAKAQSPAQSPREISPLPGLEPQSTDGASAGTQAAPAIQDGGATPTNPNPDTSSSAPSPKTPLAPGTANYGRPKKPIPLPKPYPPPRQPFPPPFSPQNPLPPLEPYRTSPQAKFAGRARSKQPVRATLPTTQQPPSTVAVIPTLPVKPKPKREENPYDPLGIGIGSMRLRPFLETSYGYDDNPNRLTTAAGDARGSRYVRGDAGIGLASEWSRHSIVGDMRFGYSNYFDYESASRPDGSANVKARYDITRDTAIVFDSKFDFATQNPGSPNLTFNLGNNVVAVNRPFVLTMESTLGLRQKFNRLEVTLRGFFERAMYQDALLSDGTTLDLSSTDYNGYGGIVRASYEISPDLKPFIESKVTVRIHDTPVDVFGFYRDSHGMAIKGGAEFRISDFLKGEAAIGYAERKYVDFRLPKLPGTTIDGSLVYTPTALTKVTLRAATNFYETTAANAAGVLNRAFTAEISHDFFRNFTATAQLTYYENNYVGANIFERGFTGGVKLDYKMTRDIWLRASYSHEKLSSTTPLADYSANVWLIGLRFQL